MNKELFLRLFDELMDRKPTNDQLRDLLINVQDTEASNTVASALLRRKPSKDGLAEIVTLAKSQEIKDMAGKELLDDSSIGSDTLVYIASMCSNEIAKEATSMIIESGRWDFDLNFLPSLVRVAHHGHKETFAAKYVAEFDLEKLDDDQISVIMEMEANLCDCDAKTKLRAAISKIGMDQLIKVTTEAGEATSKE